MYSIILEFKSLKTGLTRFRVIIISGFKSRGCLLDPTWSALQVGIEGFISRTFKLQTNSFLRTKPTSKQASRSSWVIRNHNQNGESEECDLLRSSGVVNALWIPYSVYVAEFLYILWCLSDFQY